MTAQVGICVVIQQDTLVYIPCSTRGDPYKPVAMKILINWEENTRLVYLKRSIFCATPTQQPPTPTRQLLSSNMTMVGTNVSRVMAMATVEVAQE